MGNQFRALEPILPGMVPIFSLSSLSLSVELIAFEDMCKRLEEGKDSYQEPFAQKWMQWQQEYFHLLSPGQQNILESLPGWKLADGNLQQRRRVPFHRIIADFKAYAASTGLKVLVSSTSHVGLKEKVLRQRYKRLRHEYSELKRIRRTQQLRIHRKESLKRLTPEHIRQLESIPGWRWRLRTPRGQYKKR